MVLTWISSALHLTINFEDSLLPPLLLQCPFPSFLLTVRKWSSLKACPAAPRTGTTNTFHLASQLIG